MLWKQTQRHVYSGRRGRKRKAEVQAEEEKPSVEEKKDGGEEEENGQEGQRVVIEHWWVTYARCKINFLTQGPNG